MGQADWTELSNVLGAGIVRRGVSMAPAFSPPDGDFVWGFHSLAGDSGVVALYNNQAGFGPAAAGKTGVVSACMKRYHTSVGFAPFIGIVDSSDADTAKGYLLALSDEASPKIVLKKGAISASIKSTDSGVLRAATGTISNAVWYHLKLEVVFNPQGDLVLNVYQNDLTVNNPNAPSWEAITGMDRYVDDSLGILQGTIPYTGPFYFVKGFYTEAALRAALFDYYRAAVQLNP